MAKNGDSGAEEDRLEKTDEPRECIPCRGSGQVISNLGGEPSKITCPWCGGGGIRVPETNAQAHWPANEPPAEKADAAA